MNSDRLDPTSFSGCFSYRAYATRAPTTGSRAEVLGVSLAVSLTEPEEVSRMQAA